MFLDNFFVLLSRWFINKDSYVVFVELLVKFAFRGIDFMYGISIEKSETILPEQLAYF